MVEKLGWILSCLILLSCTASQTLIENSETSLSETKASSADGSLPFKIVELERLPKREPQYVLFRVRAVLKKEPPEITEANVRATLQSLLLQVRTEAQQRGEQIDGVSAFLSQSELHLAGSLRFLGNIEWWPKGHSLSHDNVANITNKATYVEKIHIYPLPRAAKSVVGRLSERERRAIHTDLVRSENRATREAEAKYPINVYMIPMDKLKTYDWETALEKHNQEQDKLNLKYREELLRQYGITKEELKEIRKEALTVQWPLPPMD